MLCVHSDPPESALCIESSSLLDSLFLTANPLKLLEGILLTCKELLLLLERLLLIFNELLLAGFNVLLWLDTLLEPVGDAGPLSFGLNLLSPIELEVETVDALFKQIFGAEY